MREKGWNIPMLPVDVIEAEDEQDAKKKLLAITSQYGEFDIDGYMEFTSDIEVDDSLSINGFTDDLGDSENGSAIDGLFDDGEKKGKEPKTCPHCGALL